jgi:hypothetical protein
MFALLLLGAVAAFFCTASASPAAAAPDASAVADKRYMRVGRARSQASFARLGRAGGMGLEGAKRNELESYDMGGYGKLEFDKDPLDRQAKRNDRESNDLGGFGANPFDGDASVESKRYMRVGRFARLG